jgi:hypothetical protein
MYKGNKIVLPPALTRSVVEMIHLACMHHIAMTWFVIMELVWW